MTVTVLFASTDKDWAAYKDHLPTACAAAGVDATFTTDASIGEKADYIVYAPSSSVQDFTPFTNAKAVLSLWAGVESIVDNKTLTQPLCRMVDEGLTDGMVEWVTGHVLRYHLGMDAHIHGQDGEWRWDVLPPKARDRSVCILGLGELGTACALALKNLNFKTSGWSRRAKNIDGVTCHHGQQGLKDALSTAEIVVTLLPDTPATENTLNIDTLSMLPKGAFILNPGRGPLIDDDALLGALDSGQIAHATLDVFRVEPLPKDHPYWAHPRVTVTPHIAAATRPSTASDVIAENIRRGQAGEPFLHLVDRNAGY